MSEDGMSTFQTDSFEVTDYLSWLGREYPMRKQVETPNPGSVMYQRFEALRDELASRVDAATQKNFAVLRAFGDEAQRRWYDIPGLEIKARDESANLRWPVLRLRLMLLAEKGEWRLALFDSRHMRDEFTYDPEGEELIGQRNKLRGWLGRTQNQGWFDGWIDGLASDAEVDRSLSKLSSSTLMSLRLPLETLSEERFNRELEKVLRRWQAYNEAVRAGQVEQFLRNESKPSIKAKPYDDKEPRLPDDYKAPVATNRILYGPPGTGKTYSTARRALEICVPTTDWSAESFEKVMIEYRRLREAKRIEVVTFHQSYGYEEFIEGIRPVLQSIDEEVEATVGGDVRYRCEYGVFKRIALLAASAGLALTEDDQQFEVRWQALQNKIDESGDYKVSSRNNNQYYLRTALDDQILVQRADGDRADPTTYTITSSTALMWWKHRDKLGLDFQNIKSERTRDILPKSTNFTPNWIIYKELRSLGNEDIKQIHSASNVRRLSIDERVGVARKYLKDGPTARFNRFEDAENYVLIIDEINRGNISKILGELITLLEPSKRLTCEQEMVVTLPYSKERFGVPPNLHIVGTMNTADRSIALMDVALRRRFQFEEMMPDWRVIVDVLSEKTGGGSYGDLGNSATRRHINLVVALFETINERIRFLYDPDHQIGHAYFLDATDADKLRETLVRNIIPLLQEYFYNSWDRICLVLGCPYTEKGTLARSTNSDRRMVGRPIVRAQSRKETSVLLMDHDDYEDLIEYRIDPNFQRSMQIEVLNEFFSGVLAPDVLADVESGKYIDELQAGARE